MPKNVLFSLKNGKNRQTLTLCIFSTSAHKA